MNKQIRGLIDQACDYANTKHFANVKKFKYVTPEQMMAAENTRLEKFAELIVKDVLAQVGELQKLDGVYKNKVGIDFEIDVAKEVLKNFGIEE